MLTDEDLSHCAEVWRELIGDAGNYDGPEVVMTSTGYVQVWLDGEVTANGDVVGVVGE